jgi:hypothetical protein
MLAVAGASVLRPSATRAFAAEPSQPAPRLPPLGSPASEVEAGRSMAALRLVKRPTLTASRVADRRAWAFSQFGKVVSLG